jgi:diguanylate cyclase (GGDEF)-like protein
MQRRFSYGLVNGMLSAGVPIGLLAVRWMRRRRHETTRLRATAEDIATAAVFATFGYLLGRKADELAERADTDALTGLYNARGFEARLSGEIARTARYRTPLSLLLIDLDRLKEINDVHGHYAGQAALRGVASAIRAQLRATDVGARWGGDEFAVVAPNTPTGAAWAMAERIRAAIVRASTKWPLTASIGITTLGDADAGRDVDAETLMRSADAALYEAKRHGRNRVAMARPLTKQEAQRANARRDELPFESADSESALSH